MSSERTPEKYILNVTPKELLDIREFASALWADGPDAIWKEHVWVNRIDPPSDLRLPANVEVRVRRDVPSIPWYSAGVLRWERV